MIHPFLIGSLVWAGGVVLLFGGYTAIKGQLDLETSGDAAGLIFFWPVVAVGLVLISPILLGYVIGRLCRKVLTGAAGGSIP